MSHAIYLIRQVTHNIIKISVVEKFLLSTVITDLNLRSSTRYQISVRSVK